MKKILIISLALFAFTACKKKDVNTSDDVVVEEVKVEELKLITFSKTPCYGQCPTYTATITPQGEVAFEGRRFTPVEGVHEFKMTQDFVGQIFAKAKEIDFFNLKDVYDKEGVTDIPSTTLTIETNNKTKKVYARFEVPTEIKDLNNFVHNEIMRLAEKKKTYLDKTKSLKNRDEKGRIISDKKPVNIQIK